jgi:hypothetical protein
VFIDRDGNMVGTAGRGAWGAVQGDNPQALRWLLPSGLLANEPTSAVDSTPAGRVFWLPCSTPVVTLVSHDAPVPFRLRSCAVTMVGAGTSRALLRLHIIGST